MFGQKIGNAAYSNKTQRVFIAHCQPTYVFQQAASLIVL